MVIGKEDYNKLLNEFPQQSKQIKSLANFKHSYVQKVKQQALKQKVQKPIFQKIMKRQQNEHEKLFTQNSNALNKNWKLIQEQNVEQFLIDKMKQDQRRNPNKGKSKKLKKKQKSKEQLSHQIQSQAPTPDSRTNNPSTQRIIISNQNMGIQNEFTVSNVVAPQPVPQDEDQSGQEEEKKRIDLDQMLLNEQQQQQQNEFGKRMSSGIDQQLSETSQQNHNNQKIITKFIKSQERAQRTKQQLKLSSSMKQILETIQQSTSQIVRAMNDIKLEKKEIKAHIQSNSKKLKSIKRDQSLLMRSLKK